MQEELQNKLSLTLSNLLDDYINEEVERRLKERCEHLIQTIRECIYTLKNVKYNNYNEVYDVLHDIYMYRIDDIKSASLSDVLDEVENVEGLVSDAEDYASQIDDDLEDIIETLEDEINEKIEDE